MDAVCASISNVGKEAEGQLALDVKVPLLRVPVLLHGVACRREVVLRQDVLRNIGLRVAAGYGDQVVGPYASGSLVERPRSETGEGSVASTGMCRYWR